MRRIRNLVVLLLVAGLAVLIGNTVTDGAFSYQALVVRTGSMDPTIPSKSLVIVKTGDYHVGQVVSFHKGDQIVSHRLVKRNADGSYTTKGDANSTADAVPLEAGRIIGGVVEHVGELGFWIFWLHQPLTLASLALLLLFVWLTWPILFGEDEPSDDVALPQPA